jgi:hypothetical protein
MNELKKDFKFEFSKNIAILAKILQKKNATIDINEAENGIRKWFKNTKKGHTDNIYMNQLLSVDREDRKNPIWWSGFYVEDPAKRSNPNILMRKLAELFGGYTTQDTPFYNSHGVLNKHIKFFNKNLELCKNAKSNLCIKFGDKLSATFTTLALKKHPKTLYYFFNKNMEDFERTFFYTVEVERIKKYLVKNPEVILTVINLKNTDPTVATSIKQKLVKRGISPNQIQYKNMSMLENKQKRVAKALVKLDSVRKNKTRKRKTKLSS